MKSLDTYIALNKFGLGPRKDETSDIANDPRGWILKQIKPEVSLPSELRRFRTASDILRDIHVARRNGPDALRKVTRTGYREEFGAGIISRAQLAIATDAPFHERIVDFWSNHFTVSNSKRIIGPAIPAYEREVIRPHVFGRFADMLKAVCRHPVMLAYLDNVVSIGENSPLGQRRMKRTGATKTLNENLGREILELHTLGVAGGYSQDDVLELARAITGWTVSGVGPARDGDRVHGGFQFRHVFHEPGAKTVLGKTYHIAGPDQGLHILDDLARHPSTARFIATKLARHFVADNPPEAAIETLTNVFRDSDGDLAEVSKAIVNLDACWQNPGSKVRSHYEFVIAVNRATGNLNAGRPAVFLPLQELGQVPFTAPSPAGWGDTAADWVAPEALMRRIEWTRRFAGTQSMGQSPAQMVDALVGPVASEATRIWANRAPSADSALALVLTSPEFQRR